MCRTVLVGYILLWLVDDDLPRSVVISGAVKRLDGSLCAAVLHELDESDAWLAGSTRAEARVVEGSKLLEFGLELLLGHIGADPGHKDVLMCTGDGCTGDT